MPPTRILLRPSPMRAAVRVDFLIGLVRYRWRVVAGVVALVIGTTAWCVDWMYAARVPSSEFHSQGVTR